jgi:alkylresorcinol/alkylpyrone synthase
LRIAGAGHAFPEHFYEQSELIAAFREHWGQRHHNLARLEALHRNVLVGGRHLALALETYEQLNSFGETNDAFIRVGLDVGEAALRKALSAANLAPEELDFLLFTTVTGLATPSLDARLVNRLGISRSVRRLPFFGLGCVAGAAGVARAADLVRGRPGSTAALVAVELCSLTLQREDLSVPNLIASGLFGDGAAAVVVVAEDHARPGPRVVASRSVFYPDTEDVMGWKITERGFGIVLSSEVPEMVRGNLRGDVDSFLEEHALHRSDMAAWIAHPGGPRVLEAMQEVLELPANALETTWRSLGEVGNLSSASVLLVLEETLGRDLPPGGYGLMLAMGPGFCSELVLLQWPE